MVRSLMRNVQAFALIFENNHGFNQWQTGLTFLGIFVGMVTGVNCDPLWRRNCECNVSVRLSAVFLER